MSTISRLKRLTGEAPDLKSEKPPVKKDIEELRRKIDAIMARKPESKVVSNSVRNKSYISAEKYLGAELIHNSHGSFLFCRTRFAAMQKHGSSLIRDCLNIDMKSCSILANSRAIKDFSPHDALFFDTETTGLSGGTGTFAFLIGLGWFEGEDFITCQLFARDYADEKAMLAFLNETAQGKGFLVSFNGRAYDLNLLSSRFVLNRFENELMGKPHLDLLNPSRRLLSHRTTNCRLVTLEDEVLGFSRTGDVPGFEIPQRYFDWLRRRDPALMEDVFEHNRLDIVSMAALGRHLSDVVSVSDTGEKHAGDLLAAARLHYELGDEISALSIIEEVMSQVNFTYSFEAKKMLSLIHKKSGRLESAACLWQEMLLDDMNDKFTLIELAKYCEHRLHDINRAIAHVEQALQNDALEQHERDAFIHRLNRLTGKMKHQAEA
jgi:hypothetical protein